MQGDLTSSDRQQCWSRVKAKALPVCFLTGMGSLFVSY